MIKWNACSQEIVMDSGKSLPDQKAYNKVCALKKRTADFRDEQSCILFWCDENEKSGIMFDGWTHVVTVWGVEDEGLWVWIKGTFQDRSHLYYELWQKYIDDKMNIEIEKILG